MKKSNFSFSRAMSVSLAAVTLIVLLAACKKDLDTPPAIPASGVMVLNLAPDQDALGVGLSGSLLTRNPLGYTNFTGNYQSVYTGQREIQVYDYLTDSVVVKNNFDFRDGELYSIFVTGNKGVYNTVVAKDEVDSTASSDKAYIRFINAVPDSSSPVITVNANGTKVFDDAADFNTVSPFAAVNGGSVTITVANGSTISANRTISLDNGWVYTALVVGDPAATDSTKKVQIRYIQNGIVPAAEQK